MRWKVVLQITKGAEDRGVPRVLSDGYSDGLFSTPRADKDGGELLLDNADYSASSSPQRLELYKLGGQDSIFTFGSVAAVKHLYSSIRTWGSSDVDTHP